MYRLTTNPGLEDIVETELFERANSCGLGIGVTQKPFGLAGHILVELDAGDNAGPPDDDNAGPPAGDGAGPPDDDNAGPPDDGAGPPGDGAGPPDDGAGPPAGDGATAVERFFIGMRSVYHVVRHLARYELSDGPEMSEIIAAVEDTDFSQCAPQSTFRVSSERIGTHVFRSVDIEREAGTVVQRKTGMSVDLERFDRHIRVDLVDTTLLVGVQTTREGLDRRYAWRYRPRVSLRTVVAYSLLRLASQPLETDNITAILDPFCGSGTILLEAANLFPNARIYGSDLFEPSVLGSRENIHEAGMNAQIEVSLGDARDLMESWPARCVDMVVTNPPFGVRLGRKTDFRRLYHRFLAGAAHVLRPGGRLVFLGGRRRHFVTQVLEDVRELSLKHVRVIETGGVYPAVYVLTRLPDNARDEDRQSQS